MSLKHTLVNVPQPAHPLIAGRRAAIRFLRGGISFAEAFTEEVIRPAMRPWIAIVARKVRLTIDRKAAKRKRQARARCGYRR
jgi:hypothetical protein